MQKAMLWAAVVALIACGGQATGVKGEEQVTPTDPPATPNELEEIQIEVTSEGIGYADKESVPIPELTFGLPFRLTVTWRDPAMGSLTLSGFRLVAFDPTAYAEGRTIWPPDRDYSLELQDENGTAIRSISFPMSGAGSTTRTLTLQREKINPKRDTERPQLILFNVSARVGDTEFVLDPPWAGKPPTG